MVLFGICNSWGEKRERYHHLAWTAYAFKYDLMSCKAIIGAENEPNRSRISDWRKRGNMDYKGILDKIENMFIHLGFTPVIINDVKFMRFKECYCKMTFINDWSAFVIESADNIQDVRKGVLEDGDIYYMEDVTEDELLVQVRLDLLNYYMN